MSDSILRLSVSLETVPYIVRRLFAGAHPERDAGGRSGYRHVRGHDDRRVGRHAGGHAGRGGVRARLQVPQCMLLLRL